MTAAGRSLGAGSTFVVGFDLLKDPTVLETAYNDASGLTAAFNLNVPARLNRELDGDFPLHAFVHDARFNGRRSRIEMHLRACARLTVKLRGETIRFRSGETIHTENSYKFTPHGIAKMAALAGWSVRRLWVDSRSWFAVAALSR